MEPEDQRRAKAKRSIGMSVSFNQLLDKVELDQAITGFPLGSFLRVDYEFRQFSLALAINASA